MGSIWFLYVHAVCCITISNLDIHDHGEDYLNTSTFNYTYSHHVQHVLDEDRPNVLASTPMINPPGHKHAFGKLTKRKFEWNGVGFKSLRTCRSCKQVGSHNKNTCILGK